MHFKGYKSLENDFDFDVALKSNNVVRFVLCKVLF